MRDAMVRFGVRWRRKMEDERAAWEEAERASQSAGVPVQYHPKPPSYCFD